MNLTYKVAQTSDYRRFRMGAIIARKNKILSVGTNSKKSHPIQAKFSCRPFNHAWRHCEVHAISLCKAGDLIGSDIYVGRILANDEWAASKPCSGCLKALIHYGIKGMYFFQDGKIYYDSVNPQ